MNQESIGISCFTYYNKIVLDNTHIRLAEMVRISYCIRIFINESLVINLIFCKKIMGINIQCGRSVHARTLD